MSFITPTIDKARARDVTSFSEAVSIKKCRIRGIKKIRGIKNVFHHTDTSLYLLSLALALSIHNKLL